MEVKLSQRTRADCFSLLPKLLPQPILPSQTHRNWANTKRSLNNQFRAIALRWRFQIQDISKDQLSTMQHFVHIVEGSETLTSISKQNGVPTHSIVIANRKIMDADLEQRGQDIKIQSPQAIRDIHQLQEKLQSSLNRLRNYRKLSTISSPYLPPGEGHKFRSGHWRSALRDIREFDGFDSEPSVDSTSPEEEQISVEDFSHAYKKLDQDYEKFLSECGLSKWGYWRGGSQSPQ